jgi:glycosyltransferase involved in cell wall biosynthesis
MNVLQNEAAGTDQTQTGNRARAESSRHIALVAPLLSKSATGPSFYVANLVPHLCDAGYRVTVLATDCGYAGAEAGELVTIDPRAMFKLFHVTGRFNRRVCRSTEMALWLRNSCDAFDVVDIQGIWNWVTADVAQICRSTNLPYVITPHGMMARWDWDKRPLAKRAYFQLVYKECWRSAAAVRFLSAGERDNCMIPPQTPVAVIPNAVSIAENERSEEIARFKVGLNMPATAPMVLFLGRVTPQKGVLELIEAFDIARQRRADAVLAVAGWLDGGYGEAVQAYASRVGSRDSIRFLGPVHGEVKARLLASASVFVTLSRNEGQPIAVLEALASGIPTVLTVNSNVPEVSEYAAGVITELDPTKAANAISGLLLDEERRRVMAQNARRLAVERFSWNTVLGQLTGLYGQVFRR